MAALTPSEQAAVSALKADAGCTTPRAEALARAIGRAAADEALDVTSGTAQVYGSAVDARVARLQRLIGALEAQEPVPTPYEVGVIFRITVPQARNVLRTYEARFSKAHRERMRSALAAVKAEAMAKDGAAVWRFEFADPAVLEYAVEILRRRGLVRGVRLERASLELFVERDSRDRHDKDARSALDAAASDAA